MVSSRSAVTVGAWAARRLTAPSIAALGPKLMSVNPMSAYCYVNGAHRGEVEELVVQIRRFGIVLTALISRAVWCTRRVETRRVPVGGSVAMMVSTSPIVWFWRGKMAHTESRILRFRGGNRERTSEAPSASRRSVYVIVWRWFVVNYTRLGTPTAGRGTAFRDTLIQWLRNGKHAGRVSLCHL